MDKLPVELTQSILHQCIATCRKSDVLRLRLVCRLFDSLLKSHVLRTLNVDFQRLSRRSPGRRPDSEALQTIGYRCRSLYVDLMVLRDEAEVEFLEFLFVNIPSMLTFCQQMHKKYTMNEETFTEAEYHNVLTDVLFNCRDIDRLRLALPFQLAGKYCGAATRVLANTLKAFAQRPEEDSAQLRTLVLENVTYVALCQLWMNPLDLMNIIAVFRALDHLVITVRRHESPPRRAGIFGSCLWNLIENAEVLKSLCLIGADHDEGIPRRLEQTISWQMSVDEWRTKSLPAPGMGLTMLTHLELKKMDMTPEALLRLADLLGSTLRELYLNQVYLKVESGVHSNRSADQMLWVGPPNVRPGPDQQWIAMALRCLLPELRVCRVSFLGYNQYLHDDETERHPHFDWIDPCGLSRSLAQRFVEVVTGVEQPNSATGEPVVYLPAGDRHDHLLRNLKPRSVITDRPGVSHSAVNYQSAVANRTSCWLHSLDGTFPNCNPSTLDELHFMAETACAGMNERHSREQGWTGYDDEGAENHQDEG